MSKKINDPDQLHLPFTENSRAISARIFSFSEHRQRSESEPAPSNDLTKEAEQKILDRVLERAERLSWYK